MSNKTITLECVYSGAQYFKLKIGKDRHLKFVGGKATLTEEQWESVKLQVKNSSRPNMIGLEFGPVGSVKNPAVIEPIKTVRGLDKGSIAMSSPVRAEKSVEDHIADVDAERTGAQPQPKANADEISPEQAASLVADEQENQRLLANQAQIDVEEQAAERARRKAERAAARAASKS